MPGRQGVLHRADVHEVDLGNGVVIRCWRCLRGWWNQPPVAPDAKPFVVRPGRSALVNPVGGGHFSPSSERSAARLFWSP